MIRRAVDFMFAAGILILLLPVFVLIAMVVCIDSRGNPFYGGWRAGKDGRPFRMWKFRTMVPDADKIGPGITSARDSRLTRVGPLLRSTKVDELPQFFNLLIGDLTLIGPRPEVPAIVTKYKPHHREVLAYKPGITGVGALHYTTTQSETIPVGVAVDDYYVEHLLDDKLALEIAYEKSRTFSKDLRVVVETLLVVIAAVARFAPSRS